MEAAACIFCETRQDADEIVIEENGFLGRKCISCGLIYTSPRPSPSQVINLYGHDKSHISAQHHIAEEFPKRLYARHHLSLIQQYVQGGALLEIGAGAGYFLNEAKAAGFDVYGIELNRTQTDFIRHELGIPCEDQPLTDRSFGEKRFDLIYHSDVISHFHDPVGELQTISRRLKPGGLMIYETGNLSDVAPKYFGAYIRFQYPDHLFFFGESNSRQLLRLTGYELVAIHRYSILPHLLLSKLMNSLRSSRRSLNASTGDAKPGGVTQNRHQNKALREWTRRAWQYGMYLLRYRAGSVLPRRGRPQTMIFVARKL